MLNLHLNVNAKSLPDSGSTKIKAWPCNAANWRQKPVKNCAFLWHFWPFSIPARREVFCVLSCRFMFYFVKPPSVPCLQSLLPFVWLPLLPCHLCLVNLPPSYIPLFPCVVASLFVTCFPRTIWSPVGTSAWDPVGPCMTLRYACRNRTNKLIIWSLSGSIFLLLAFYSNSNLTSCCQLHQLSNSACGPSNIFY